MYAQLRPWLFRLDPERAHWTSLRLLQIAGALPLIATWLRKLYSVPNTDPVELIGLKFPNRLGLAAGYDKDGLAWRGLACLGFGHIEIGTVTPRSQPGNPRPRLFRLVEDEALINRLGFPGRGALFVAKRMRGARLPGLVLGVNLGINKDTALERAAEDYLSLMEVLSPLADYLVINISSPNTPGLRQLQTREYLEGLLDSLTIEKSKPLLVKLSPDLDNEELEQALAVIMEKKVDGIIATNTTTARLHLQSNYASESGGLSGAPLTVRVRKMVANIYKLTNGKLPIVAVGGIMSGEASRAALDAGASLVQIYTGLVYRGPGLVKEILQANDRVI